MVAKQFGTEVETHCSHAKFESDDVKKNVLKNKYDWTWEKVRLKYETINELATLINQLFGWNIGIDISSYILFNSITIDELFVPGIFPDFWQIVGILAYTTGLCMFNFMCVDICGQV